MRKLVQLIIGILVKSNFITSLYLRLDHFFLTTKYKELESNNLINLAKLLTPSPFPLALLERVGNESDGGYVIFNKIDKKTQVISLGVGHDISFEKDMENRVLGTQFFDHTVFDLPIDIKNSQFNGLKISELNEKNSVSLNALLSKMDSEYLILKIDIEGQEWDSFLPTSEEQLLKCTQIVGEFHNLHRISDKAFYEKINMCLRKILKSHVLINSHANNWGGYIIVHGVPLPDVLELTFLRKDLYDDVDIETTNSFAAYASTLQLNKPNNPNRPEIKLSFFH